MFHVVPSCCARPLTDACSRRSWLIAHQQARVDSNVQERPPRQDDLPPSQGIHPGPPCHRVRGPRHLEQATGWSAKKFVTMMCRYRTIQIQAGQHTIPLKTSCPTTPKTPSTSSATTDNNRTNCHKSGSTLVDGRAGSPDDHDLTGVRGVDILPPFAGG